MTVARAPGAALHAPGPRRRDRRRRADPRPGPAPRLRVDSLVVSEADILDGIAWSPRAAMTDLRCPTRSPGSPSPARCRPAPAGPTTRPTPARRWRDGCRRTPMVTIDSLRPECRLANRHPRPSWTPGCRSAAACPRLVDWREDVAVRQAGVVRRPALLGPPDRRAGATREPRVLIVGLAPAANGGNRTGRVFTGDRSGDWLFASLHRVGLAAAGRPARTPATASALLDTRMVATVRCAPPREQADHRRARHLRALARRRARAWSRRPAGRGRAGWLRLGRRRCARWPPPGSPCRGPSRGSATAPRSRSPARRRVDAARLLPPQPAEHLHRPAHRDDARRRARPGRGAGRARLATATISLRPRIPTGRGSRLKSDSVWVRPPAGAPSESPGSAPREHHAVLLVDVGCRAPVDSGIHGGTVTAMATTASKERPMQSNNPVFNRSEEFNGTAQRLRQPDLPRQRRSRPGLRRPSSRLHRPVDLGHRHATGTRGPPPDDHRLGRPEDRASRWSSSSPPPSPPGSASATSRATPATDARPRPALRSR